MGKKKFGFGRQGHGSITDYYSGKKTLEELRSHHRESKYPGNAPPMRAITLGFMKDDDDIWNLAIKNGDSTHPNPKSRISSLVVALAAKHLLINKFSQETLINSILHDLENPPSKYRNLINDSESIEYLNVVNNLPDYHTFEVGDVIDIPLNYMEILCKSPQPFKRDIIGMPCCSMTTGGCVLYILKHYTTPLDALKMSMWLGGDVDSLGSIVLGIASGRDGISTLPKFLISEVEESQYLIDIGTEFGEYIKNQWKN